MNISNEIAQTKAVTSTYTKKFICSHLISYFKTDQHDKRKIFAHFPRGTEENQEETQSGRQVSGHILKYGTFRVRSRGVEHSTTTFVSSLK